MERDRRQHPRATFASVRVLLDGEEGFRDEFVQDLSPGGLLLRTDRTLPVGSRLEVRILRPDAKPLRLHSIVRRLEVALEGMPAMALEFVGVHEGADADLARMVEPYVQAFRREVAQMDLRSNEALESGVERLKQQLDSLDAAAVGMGFEGADASPISRAVRREDRPEEEDEDLPEATRLARAEAELEIASERARSERSLRSKVESELATLRARLRQLEEVRVDKVELEEKLAEVSTQLQYAQELVRRSSAVAREAISRLELVSEGAAAGLLQASQLAAATASPDEEESQAGGSTAEMAVQENADDVPRSTSQPQPPVSDAAQSRSQMPPSPDAGAADLSRETTPPVAEGASPPEPIATHQGDDTSIARGLPEREPTLVPLGPEDESSATQREEDDENDRVEEAPEPLGAAEEGAPDDVASEAETTAAGMSNEFELDLSGVVDEEPQDAENVGRGRAIALGSSQETAGREDDAGETEGAAAAPLERQVDPGDNFVPLSEQALAAAKQGRGAEFSSASVDLEDEGDHEIATDGSGREGAGEDDVGDVSGGGDKGDEVSGHGITAASSSPAFEWQEEPPGDASHAMPALGVEPDDDDQPDTGGRGSEAPTRPLRLEDLKLADQRPSQLEQTPAAAPPTKRDLGQELREERQPVTSLPSREPSAPKKPAAKAARLGPEEVPTREVFVERLEAGLRLEKTERFHRLEPVSRADISVSDWLARTDEYGELAKLAEDLMPESELQRVLHLFFERGLLVLRETS